MDQREGQRTGEFRIEGILKGGGIGEMDEFRRRQGIGTVYAATQRLRS